MSSSKGVIKSSEVKVVEKVLHGERPAVVKPAFQTNPLILEAQKHHGGLAQGQKTELEDKIKQAKQESYDKGFTEGVNKGITVQKEETRRAINAVAELMAELTKLRHEIIEKTEQQIVQLAFAIAAKVIHQEVKQDTTVVASVLREAVRSVTDRDGMKVRLNPHDFKYIMEIKEDFLKEMDGVKNIVFKEDPGIKAGGVMVETIFGEVDARLEQQFNEIKAGFNLV
jgi:flagellar assembly protein FliH